MNVVNMLMGAYDGLEDDVQGRCDALDLFDRFLEADIYDIDRVIDQYKRNNDFDCPQVD